MNDSPEPQPDADLPQPLVDFVAQMPYERQPILDLVLRASRELPRGARLLDVGAGDSPYRALFTHLRYETADWENTFHVADGVIQHKGPAHDIPVEDASFDAVLCTQVLEHVPNPREVVHELHRVLRQGGHIYMTLPFVWELHEIPFDYFRYTSSSLHAMLADAGFMDIDIRARNDSFGTLSQLLRNVAGIIGPYPDGLDEKRVEAVSALRAMAGELEQYVGLDKRWLLPLGYAITARRPAEDVVAVTDAHDDHLVAAETRAALGLSQARAYVTLCFADDALLDPFLLERYARHFGSEDDATLVIYAPNTDPQELSSALFNRVAELGLDGPAGPDMIGLPFRGRADEARLRSVVDAVLAPRPPWGTFAGLPWAHAGTLAELRKRIGSH